MAGGFIKGAATDLVVNAGVEGAKEIGANRTVAEVLGVVALVVKRDVDAGIKLKEAVENDDTGAVMIAIVEGLVNKAKDVISLSDQDKDHPDGEHDEDGTAEKQKDEGDICNRRQCKDDAESEEHWLFRGLSRELYQSGLTNRLDRIAPQ